MRKRNFLALPGALLVAGSLTVVPQAIGQTSTSAYPDAEELGRNNVISEREPIAQLNPTVTGGETALQPGDKFNYEFTLDTGFDTTANGDWVIQRWNKVKVCQDPSAPFDSAPTTSLVPGAESVTQLDANCWEFNLGDDYGQYGDLFLNQQHPQLDGFIDQEFGKVASIYTAPDQFTLSIPATVQSTVTEGQVLNGSATLLSGRVGGQLPESDLSTKFIRNNNDGTCVFESTHHDFRPGGASTGAWLQAVNVSSDYQGLGGDPEAEDNRLRYAELPYYAKYNDPQMLGGTVNIAGDPSRTYDLDAFAWNSQFFQFGSYEDVLQAFTSNEWVEPQEDLFVTVQYTNPCGYEVNEEVFNQAYTDPNYEFETPDHLFVQAFEANVTLARPPEDAQATANYAVTIAAEPTPTPTTSPEEPTPVTETVTETTTATTTETQDPNTITETVTPEPVTTTVIEPVPTTVTEPPVTETTTVNGEPTTIVETVPGEPTTITETVPAEPVTETETTTVEKEPVTETVTETTTELNTETTTLEVPTTVEVPTTITTTTAPETITETAKPEPKQEIPPVGSSDDTKWGWLIGIPIIGGLLIGSSYGSSDGGSSSQDSADTPAPVQDPGDGGPGTNGGTTPDGGFPVEPGAPVNDQPNVGSNPALTKNQPSGNQSNYSASGATAPQTATKSSGKSSLANTGASVIGIAIAALLLVITGLALMRRKHS